MEEKLLCSVCGKELTEDNIYDVGGKHLCIDCFESRTSSCSYCGERIWTDEVFGDEYIVLCRNCYDRYYTQCEECGIVIHTENAYYNDDDEEYPYCLECYNKLFRSAIKSYNYKPEPIFYGSGSLYFGVEIEVDKGGEDNQNAKDKYSGRYVAVNLENYHTIEIRIFRGTLNFKTFIATLQLIEEICNHAIYFDDKYFEKLSWSEFVKGIDKEKKLELIEYLKAKQLYVNELTEQEEDL